MQSNHTFRGPGPGFPSKCAASWLGDDCSLLSGSLELEARLIGVHFKKRYINL